MQDDLYYSELLESDTEQEEELLGVPKLSISTNSIKQ